METKCNCFYRVIAFLSLLLCLVMFILTFTFPLNNSKSMDKYIECKNNITLYSRSKHINEEIEKKCDNIPNLEYFLGNIMTCLYSIFRAVVNISFLFIGDCYFKFLFVLIPLYLFNLEVITYIKYKPYVLAVRVIFLITDSIINIISLSYCCCSEERCGQVCEENTICNSDCLDVYFEKEKKKKRKKSRKK